MLKGELKIQYKVNIIESERGWGQKIDERLFFDSLREAEEFVKQLRIDDYFEFGKL